MSRIAMIVILASISGCAANQVQPQTAASEKPCAKQEKQVAELQGQVAEARVDVVKADSKNLAEDVWKAVKAEEPIYMDRITSAWAWAQKNTTEAFQKIEDKATACYQASLKSNPQTAEEYRALAEHCWGGK